MKLFKKAIVLFSIFALFSFSSCKKTEKNDNDNDVMNEQPGSFDDNHPETESDTSASAVDSTTSNSTQTDPTAS